MGFPSACLFVYLFPNSSKSLVAKLTLLAQNLEKKNFKISTYVPIKIKGIYIYVIGYRALLKYTGFKSHLVKMDSNSENHLNFVCRSQEKL